MTAVTASRDHWSEDDLLNATVDLAVLRRWAVTHFRPARTRGGYRTAVQGHVGFPDLVLARDGLVLFRELKSAKGRVSSEQRDWASQLCPGWSERPDLTPYQRMLVTFDVWRPGDWDTVIVPQLTATRR